MEEKHGFDFDDLKNAFEKHSRFGWDIAVHRLSQCHVTEGDPGYETLLEPKVPARITSKNEILFIIHNIMNESTFLQM